MDTLTQLLQIIDRARNDDESCMINPKLAAERVLDYLAENKLLNIRGGVNA